MEDKGIVLLEEYYSQAGENWDNSHDNSHDDSGDQGPYHNDTHDNNPRG